MDLGGHIYSVDIRHTRLNMLESGTSQFHFEGIMLDFCNYCVNEKSGLE